MTYIEQTWEDHVSGAPTTNQTATAARMTHMEAGIADADAAAEAAQEDATTALTDRIKSVAGAGTLTVAREGFDDTTGADIILKASTGGAPATPQGLDYSGGQVGCTIADPGMAVIPSSSEAETLGNVLLAGANTRIAARLKVYDVRIDRLTWYVGPGTPASVSGTILICKSDGTILASATGQNLSPATVDASVGGVCSWTLSSPITGLSPVADLVVVAQHSSTGNTVRFLARGISTLSNPTALRATGELHRGGAIAGAGALSTTAAVNFSSTASWVKHPIAIFMATRTT